MKSSSNGLSRFFDADGDIVSHEALGRKFKTDALFLALYIMKMKNQKLPASAADKVRSFFADEDRKIDRLLRQSQIALNE